MIWNDLDLMTRKCYNKKKPVSEDCETFEFIEEEIIVCYEGMLDLVTGKCKKKPLVKIVKCLNLLMRKFCDKEMLGCQ